MVGYSLVSFVGTSSWPVFPTCKDASLLLIFSYNKCCMTFSLDTFLMLISMANQGGLWVVCVCVCVCLPTPTPPRLFTVRLVEKSFSNSSMLPLLLLLCSGPNLGVLLSVIPGPISYLLELPLLCPTCSGAAEISSTLRGFSFLTVSHI